MSLLPYLHAVAERPEPSAPKTRERPCTSSSAGRPTPPQIAAFLMALRMKGETVDELVGFARAMRQMAAAGRRGLRRRAAARYLRHRRRRPRHVQYLDRRGVRGGGRGRARGQARQPLASRASAAAPTCWRRWASRIAMSAGRMRARHPRSGHRLSVRARDPHRHEARAAGARRSEDAHGVQSAGAADQSGGRQRADGRSALGARRRTDRRRAGGAGPASADSWSTARTAWTRSPPPARRWLSKSATARWSGALGAGGFRRADGAAGGSEGRRPADAIWRLRARFWKARTVPQRDIVLVNAAAALVAAGRARDFREGVALAAGAIDSGAARERAEALARFTQAG